MSTQTEMQLTIENMVQKGKGILAADESHPTMAKRFKAIDVESTEDNRRAWRSLLLTTPGLGDYVSGIILFEETLTQKSDDGTLLPELAEQQGIVPGIKVDLGKIPLVNSPGDMITQGLDFLADRLAGYKQQGARFAKWREVYPIGTHNPHRLAIEANAEVLARYAAICQSVGIVPIVEPEVLIDGDHSIERCFEVTEAVQHAVYQALNRHSVILEYTILKPSMVVPGKDHAQQADPGEVAAQTVRQLRRCVPAAVPSLNFLSGGQGPEEATVNLNAMNELFPGQPWELSFSYGRALQQPALHAWQGKKENVKAAQDALLKRARLNGAARYGKYTTEMEQA
ncbi:MAG: fructose-bisphosphate aldolase class I [Proteobacteria bacterium]|jgi:fructose-bisphosphate aldolase class I|nr:fructose-bisphosphate aldolase class I [Pseudomonadota bacterium]